MFKHILIATDGSELSHKAVSGGLEMAKALGARVTAYSCVVEYLPMTEFAVETPQAVMEQLEGEAERHLKAFAEQAAAAGVPFETVKSTEFSPYTGIIETARKHHCDLIMMASHGRRGLAGMLLGSETQKVLTHSRIPVLVYR
ncbi:MAG: universal stress protein [Betaproteobacteria bacterium]|nr:universal stress protein [Betaproteobacteria bacterium]MDE2623135.1 universal stress protein [Betaproteobacteria bacterium]